MSVKLLKARRRMEDQWGRIVFGKIKKKDYNCDETPGEIFINIRIRLFVSYILYICLDKKKQKTIN